MQVNISRSNLLFSKKENSSIIIQKITVAHCNHCGGGFKNSDGMASCIMCSRQYGHICINCAYATTGIGENKKKSA